MSAAAPSPWTSPAWLTEAGAWIEAELARLDVDLAGPVEQPHVRPWATVLKAPTGSGSVWFKASAPALAHEAAVLTVLARRHGQRLPRLLAVDRARGWMLMEDGGIRLRELEGGRPDPARWAELMALYAELQIDAAPDVEELFAAGAPDRRLAALTPAYEDLVKRADGLAPDERERLASLTSHLTGLCAELGALGLPETIQHDDLHSGNVFVRAGRPVLFDWGDACVSHPFFTLHVTMRVLAWELGVDEDAAELDRVRAAYLEPWTRYRPQGELRAALETADTLAAICRALGWQHILSTLAAEEAAEWADTVADRLRAFLAAAGA